MSGAQKIDDARSNSLFACDDVNRAPHGLTRRGLVRAAALGAGALAMFPLTACSTDGEPLGTDADGRVDDVDVADESDGAVKQLNRVTYPEPVRFDDFEKLEKIDAENPVETVFLGGLEAFANNLATYGVGEFVFDAQNPNACLSPVSLFLAMALVAQGAKGNTQTQLLDTLGVANTEILAQQCAHLMRRLWARTTPENDPHQSVLQVANSVWAHADAPLERSFYDVAARDFYAECFEVREVGYKAGEAMGEWIGERTDAEHDPQVTLADNWVASVISAVRFEDSWMTPFNENDTFADVFHAVSGDVDCRFMTQELVCDYAGTEEYQIVSLPLATGSALSFLLPAVGTDPQAYFARATGINQLFASAGVDTARVALTVPKVDFEVRTQLADVLRRMGAVDVFGDAADLSGMTKAPAHLSSVEQGTRFVLNEMGVEASAYTNAQISVTAIMSEDQQVVEMRLDRPFAFRLTGIDGAVLFVGVVGNPVTTA